MLKKKRKYDVKTILFMLLGILPLLVRIQIDNMSVTEKILFPQNKIYTEFSYLIKARFLYILAAVMLGILVYEIAKGKISWRELIKKKILWFYSIYLLGVTLSSLLTEYKDIAFFGIHERYEGWLTIVAYGIVMLFSILYLNMERFKVFVKVLAVSTIVISIIGLLQYIGIDPFDWTVSKILYLPINMIGRMDQINFEFKKNAAYSTLFNPNYVGSYMVLVLPIFVYFITQFKETKWKGILAVAFILGLMTIFGAKSSAGILGLGFVLACFILIALMNKKLKKYRIGIIASVIVLALLGGVVFRDALSQFIVDMTKPFELAQEGVQKVHITDLQKNGDHFTFKFGNGLDLNIKLNETNTPIFYDNEWNVLTTQYQSDKNIANFHDERYNFLAIKYFNDNVVGVAVYKHNYGTNISRGYVFVKTRYLNSHVVDTFGRKIDIEQEFDRIKIFDGLERMGSGRGYLWSRSIPLLYDKWIWGSGPDSYSLEFPQEDVLGKANFLISPYIIVDKPHNMYLGMGINTGVMSLLAFLTMIIMTLTMAVKKFKTERHLIFVVIGVLAFLLTNVFNDSTVATMPLFYMLLGLMMQSESEEIA